MKYGYFDDKNLEYVITTPKTPTPWINYLGNHSFYSLISNTGGGYSYFCDAKFMRITRYRYNSLPLDMDGKYLFIKDQDTVWNPTFKPSQTELDRYECRIGTGYNLFRSVKNKVEARVRDFVPWDAPCELQEITITNQSDKEKDLELFSYAEWCLWNAMDDMSNYQRNLNIAEVLVEDSMICHLTEYRERRRHYSFYAADVAVDGYDVNRDSFVGPYRSIAVPAAVERGACSNSNSADGYPIAAHQIHLHLMPGEKKTFLFMLGYIENEPDKKWERGGKANISLARQLIHEYFAPGRVQEEFEKLQKNWRELLSHYQVISGNPHINRMVNIWNQYQCIITFRVCRTASYYESGLGRQIGFRDSCQDLLGFVHIVPEEARERILNIAAIQKADGSAYHQYQPLTKKGNLDVGGGFNDDPLWLLATVSAYLRETGDFTILKEMVTYADSTETENILDHMRRAFSYSSRHLGPHGLPQIGRADWNDCLNLNCFSMEPGESFQVTGPSEGKIAESVYIAGMYVKYGAEYAHVLQYLGEEKEADEVRKKVRAMDEAVNTFGWDGQWFLRAYDAAGEKVGSSSCEEGKIFIEPQGFCIMGGIGVDNGRAQKALDSVKKYLSTPYGIMLVQPPYTSYHPELGEITSYPPGQKENGSIFCHSNPWVVIAETMIGHGEQAMEYYGQLCPSMLEEKSEIHKTEPYIYSQTVAGKDSPLYGSARNSWLTGTAAWSFVSVTQYMLGIYPELEGLRIQPCLPQSFGDFTVCRDFRGSHYHILFKKICREGSSGKVVLIVDGEEINGSLIPHSPVPGTHQVEVFYS